jgi:hypothetical protein
MLVIVSYRIYGFFFDTGLKEVNADWLLSFCDAKREIARVLPSWCRPVLIHT